MNVVSAKSVSVLLGLFGLSFFLTFEQTAPDLVDVRQYGARAVNAWWQYGTTVTGRAGTNQLAVASASTFRNGDGIVIYGAGEAPSVGTAPEAPRVIPGVSESETVPDAPLAPLSTGKATYSYRIVAWDIHGGLSAASPITRITNGPKKLGQNTIPVAQLELTRKVITVMTAVPHGLTPDLRGGPLVHIKDSTDSQTFSGWWNLSGVPNPMSIMIGGTSRDSATPRHASGGTLTYFTDNQVSWKPQAGAWEYVICAQRPGDSGLRVIGVSMPSAAVC